jgi:hypothetical protein
MTALPARLLRTVHALAGDELAIARSVLYASLFDYPLTLSQLRQTLIESPQTPSQILAAYARSESLRAAVEYRDGFFFPTGRHGLIHERRRREARSRAFLERHRTLLAVVGALPYVRMVALSGSIAHLNLETDGDLDLFIVTRGAHVWSVTVAVVLLAKLLRRRRTVCANFVIADSRLALEQHDLFTASQVVHLKPLIGRTVLLEIMAANRFVSRFYPNFHPSAAPIAPGWSWDAPSTGSATHRGSVGLVWRALASRRVKLAAEWLLTYPSMLAEGVCRRAYRGYLKRRSASWTSPEQVRLEDDVLKLHTHSHRQSVMERFEQAVRDALGPARP